VNFLKINYEENKAVCTCSVEPTSPLLCPRSNPAESTWLALVSIDHNADLWL
jgi:hypothetical protein